MTTSTYHDAGKETVEKVLAALATAADGACALDQEQRIVFWNAAAEGLLGYAATEVCGHTCYDIFRGIPHPGCLTCAPNCPVMLAARQGATIPAYNLLSKTKAGHSVLLNVSVIVLPVSADPLTTLHLFRDVTRQLRYETYVELVQRTALGLLRAQPTTGRAALGQPFCPLPLTAREKEVLSLLVQGHDPRDIAATLGLSYATVRNYLQNLLRKCGAHSQREVVKLALEQHLV